MDINILENTIRDGSYAIDFQFSVEDTALIAAGLEESGFRLIEVGHGLGLNAANSGKGNSAATDREYLKACSQVLKEAKFGMFFIPGIGRKQDLKLASEYGMNFVRIGTNVTEVEEGAEYIAYAKNLGLMVTSNLMKSYALPLDEFLEKAKLVESYGVDVIYLVDSAGGMFPEDVHNYITSLREKTGCAIGFHGHDNLNLALANTLEAVKCGASYIDSSLQGMGRSAGNTQTEVLIFVLNKLGYKLDIDLIKTLDVGERLVKPLMRERHGVDSIAVVSGASQFHSSFLSDVYKVANRYDIDPRELIIEVSEKDKVNVTEDLAIETAEKIVRERKRVQTEETTLKEANLGFNKDENKVNSALKKQARAIVNDISSLSLKKGKESIFVITNSADFQNRTTIFPQIHEDLLYLIGTAEVGKSKHIKEIVPELDGKIRTIIVDVEEKGNIKGDVFEDVKKLAPNSRVLNYKDNDLWVDAIDSLVSRICQIYDKHITITGLNNLSYKLALKLLERGGHPVISPYESENDELNVEEAPEKGMPAGFHELIVIDNKAESARGSSLIIGMTPGIPSITKEMVEAMDHDGIILDGGLGTISDEAISSAQKIGIELIRIDMRSALIGKVHELLSVDYHATTVMGKKPFSNYSIVAGGVIGERGDVIVNSISSPTQVIGIADGKGKVLYGEKKYQYRLDEVRDYIYRKKLSDIFR